MPQENEIPEAPNNQVCLNSFREHWAKSQIDAPMQAIARYDDVAKLLITIGGFLLAVLAAGYSVMLRDLRPYMNVPHAKNTSEVVFIAMLVFFVCAAAVCFPQPKMRAAEIMTLQGDEDLKEHITDWCKSLSRVIVIKKVLLLLATLSFITSFLVMMLLLLQLLSLGPVPPSH